MDFLEKAKYVMLGKIDSERQSIDEKISELSGTHLLESENVRKLKAESDEANRERAEVQRSMLSKKELNDLEMIYDFVVNYPQIAEIVERIRRTVLLTEYASNFDDFVVDDEEAFRKEVEYRTVITGFIKNLNEEISNILESDPEDFKKPEEVQEPVVEEPKEEKKKPGFFARLFGKNKEEETSSVKKEVVHKKEKNPFKQYKRTLDEFFSLYGSFIVVNLDGITVVDKNISTRIMANINNILTAEKRGFDLIDEDYDYLEAVKPHELWKEASKYYISTSSLYTCIENFRKNFDRFEKMYREKPELFDTKNLERIFIENDALISDFRTKARAASAKGSEVVRKRQEEKEISSKIKALEDKKRLLREREQKIKKATTLQDLGFKNKMDAAQKLFMESKDYVVILIPDNISNVEELFTEEKEMKVELDGNTFYASYINDVASGLINSYDNKKSASAALLVPIANLKKEDIDNVKEGKVSLSKSVLDTDGLLLFKMQSRGLVFDTPKGDVRDFSYGNIFKHLDEFFGDEFTVKGEKPENYEVFKGVPNVSSKEKKLKREAVKKCILESVRRDVVSTDTIKVNGKVFFINKEDEADIRDASRMHPLDEKFLYGLVDEIDEYILEDGKGHLGLELLYEKTLREYLRINRKAKADYYEEEYTTVDVDGKKMTIKPPLPSSDKRLAKKFTRRKEDIVYKTMKLAVLINKFAHLAEDEKLQELLYGAKKDLIENAIDLAKGRPDINIKKNFDVNKKVISVIAEVPGYNMIALHTLNASNSLSYKANRLEDHDGEILQTSAIMMPGVNRDLLMTMKNMSEENRMQFLLDMDSSVFYKLALRMGYTTDKVKTDADKKEFIKKMTSKKNLEEMLKGSDEIEK